MIKFNVLTVRHSGSRFLMKFFTRCELYRYSNLDKRPREIEDYKFGHFWSTLSQADHLNTTYSYAHGLPIVCTLRNPHDVAISWFTRKMNLNDMVAMYRQFIMFAENHNVLLFDVACPMRHRESKLKEVLEYCGVYDPKHDTAIEIFAEKWRVVGSIQSDIKQNYELSNALPKYDWKRFDGMVKWYDRKIAEFNYDNIA